MPTPEILVLSLSEIASDARVLRQIAVASELGRVTTVGYGGVPEHSDEHIQVPSTLKSLPQTPAGVAKLALRRFDAAELAAPGAAFAVDALGDRRFDLVIANEARILPAAFKVAHDAPVWADLHEYAPEERTHITSWRLLVAPFMDHICRKYLPQCAASTTVSGAIAELYAENYGVKPQLMRNATPFADLAPSPVDDEHIRLVHSGGAVPGRNIESTIDAVKRLPSSFTLDLYLLAGGDGGRYLDDLKKRAGDCERISFHDGVPPAELPRTLNAYDVGVFWLPPVHTNARLALPNKLFDYIQGRLALAISPTEEMVNVVRKYDLGLISQSSDTNDIVESLLTLTASDVRHFKQNADLAARSENFEAEAEVERDLIRSLTGSAS